MSSTVGLECVTVLITVIKVGGGAGAVSSSAVRMLFIDRLQILTTCALRHGKRDGEKKKKTMKCFVVGN